MNTTQNHLLDVLTREGVLINVSIRFWRGCKKLRPEDLGLDASQVSDRLISLGHKRLLPKDALGELNLIEGRAHALIEGNTFPFLNGLGHFLPNPRLQEVMDKLKLLETEFWQARQAFLDRYASLRASAAEEWLAMAQRLVTDPKRLVATIEQSFPMPHQMHRHFGFDTHLFQITLPERLELDLISVEDQEKIIDAREKASQEASTKIRQQTEMFVAECVATLREQTAQLCEDMLHSIQGSDKGVHQKTLNRLIHFIDQFKQMNFANDTEMERRLEEVRRELLSRTAEEYRDSAFARQQLVQGLSRLSNEAHTLAHSNMTSVVERFGELGRRKFHLAA